MSKRITYHFLFGLIAIILAVGLTGCVYDSSGDEPEAFDPDRTVYLTLNIGVVDGIGSQSSTRAGSYFYEEPLRKNEMLNNLRVYIVREDGTLEAMRRVVFDNAVTETPNSLTFKLDRGKKKVYLFGNDTSLPSEFKTLFSSIEIDGVFPADRFSAIQLTRTQNAPFFTAAQDIPMCESFDVVLDSDDERVTYVNADLYVTRIAVKYTFLCREDLEKVTVRLNGMATNQFFMPNTAEYFPGKYLKPEVINGIASRNIVSFLSPETTRRSDFEVELTGRTEVELTDETGVKSKVYRYDPIYLMETPGSEFSMSIRLGLDGGTGTWFPDHTLPNLPLLPRNTHVVVNMGVKEFILNCAVDVVPYRGCVLDPYFGLERD